MLDELNLVAEQGQTTALVGRSGGGKTTAMNMILRFYEPTAGKIVIDGQDISTIRALSLRRQIAYVSQETFLFKGSIARQHRLRPAGRERRGDRRRRQGRPRP